MFITVEAIYENGMLKLKEPLPFDEHERVEVTVRPARKPGSEAEEAIRRSYGLIGWKGSHEELEHILAEAEEFEDLP